MTGVNVLERPKPAQCRHCHEEEAVRLKDFVDLRKEILLRVDVLNNIERSRHCNGVRLNAGFSQRAIQNIVNSSSLRVFASFAAWFYQCCTNSQFLNCLRLNSIPPANVKKPTGFFWSRMPSYQRADYSISMLKPIG